MERAFEGQVALVTGGGKGIGLSIAKALATQGARVAISGRDRRALEAAALEIGDDVLTLGMDVRDEPSVLQGVTRTVEWGGRLDVLVNNAGIGLLETPLTETESEAWHDVLETNLTGAFYVTKAAWRHLADSKGQVLNVCSIAGKQGFAGASAYCASKFGLVGFTEVLKKEGAGLGIRALAICPGAVDTDIWNPKWASGEVRARMMTSDQIGVLAAQMLATPRNIELGEWVVLNAANPWAG